MELIRRLQRLIGKTQPVWSGNFASWEDATAHSTLYSDQAILEKVRSALLQVKQGKVAFERDSILFTEPDFRWPLLAALLHAFGREAGKLTIVDFGGSLGSTYFQHRAWLESFTYSWNVIEQSHFVAVGKKDFEDERLKFHDSIETVRADGPVFLLLSSVLAYLPDPYSWMDKLLDGRYQYVLIDRSPLVPGADRLTVQQVPPEIYSASYPAWFFNEAKFMRELQKHYTIFATFDCDEQANFPSKFKGHYLIHR